MTHTLSFNISLFIYLFYTVMMWPDDKGDEKTSKQSMNMIIY